MNLNAAKTSIADAVKRYSDGAITGLEAVGLIIPQLASLTQNDAKLVLGRTLPIRLVAALTREAIEYPPDEDDTSWAPGSFTTIGPRTFSVCAMA